MALPASPVVVGGYGSLCLALDGWGTEGFSNAPMRAIAQRASCTTPTTAASVPIMPARPPCGEARAAP